MDVQQIVPLPEAEDFQVGVREKDRIQREARSGERDFTTFDLTFDGKSFTGQNKRLAIFTICRALCISGITPDEIANLFKWRANRTWYWVEGECDVEKFLEQAAQKAATTGPAFSPNRWFCREGELVFANRRTYAFSSQWGGDGWRNAMTRLKESFPQMRIDFSPA